MMDCGLDAAQQVNDGLAPALEFSPKHLWAVPTLTVTHADHRELNSRLARIIEQKEREVVSSGKATPVAGLAGGLTAHWMAYNVLNWDGPAIETLKSIVLRGARQFISMIADPDDPDYQIVGISCWANILRPGQSLEIHHHDPGFLSAHYCVASGVDPDTQLALPDSGRTDYYRPGFIERSMGGAQAGVASPWDDDWRLTSPPKEGKLFFFPSFIRHEVRPNLGKKDRISIAMDFYIRKQPSSRLIYFSKPRWFVPTLQGSAKSPAARSSIVQPR